MFTRNAIWCGRTQGVGAMSADGGDQLSLRGPMLRASGVDYDVRKDAPYLGYESTTSTCRSASTATSTTATASGSRRWSSRCASWSRRSTGSTRGPVNVADPRIILPPKSRDDERHGGDDLPFQAGDGGNRPPAGEVYFGVENPKGELGYYLVSDGTAKPVRWRIRPPSFLNLAALPKMAEGAPAVRRDRHQCERGYRDGRDRPMTGHRRRCTSRSLPGRSSRSSRRCFRAIPTSVPSCCRRSGSSQEARGWISDGSITEVRARSG